MSPHTRLRASRATVACRSLVLAVLAAGRLGALEPGKTITQYANDVWQTADGLPQGSVQAIAQTPDGYLWLGTQEGPAVSLLMADIDFFKL